MPCIFRATGFSFSVDEFLKHRNVSPDTVWHKGEPHISGRAHQSSGFSMVASEADFDNVQQQISDAIEFLQHNEDDLKALRDFRGVEDRRLDFGIEDRDAAVQCDYFPPELLLLAGQLQIGVEVSRYPCKEDE